MLLIKFLLIFFPWRIKRIMLQSLFKYKLHPNAYIGFSFIYPRHLIMNSGSYIGHLNCAIHLDKIVMEENSTIARNNWITGFPTETSSKHFAHQKDRKSELIIGKESAITKNHHIDCTSRITIGNYSTIAGYRSQFLTHSIDIYKGRQDSHSIEIGDYCFISTGVIMLGGSKLPNNSVLAAGAVLNKNYTDEWKLYAGVPAVPRKDLPHDAKYFNRKQGFIY